MAPKSMESDGRTENGSQNGSQAVLLLDPQFYMDEKIETGQLKGGGLLIS